MIKAFQNKDGRDINLQFYFENTFATNLKSLRSKQPSDYFLQAMEPAQTFSIPRHDLLQLYAISTEIESCGKSLLASYLGMTRESLSRIRKRLT
jgi:CRP-like cAMP-binding protein